MNIFQVILLALIEGVTEFLPISSTGHMVIASSLMGIEQDSFVKNFTVIIQLGAILAVVVLYYQRFLKNTEFYVKLFIAFLPGIIVGFLIKDAVDKLLESPLVVAINLLLGGIFLLFIDKIFSKNIVMGKEEPTRKESFFIGLFQIIAIALPGISRSAATIVGGLTQKLNMRAAAEFSFFLAVPTMLAATGYKLLKMLKSGDSHLSEHLITLGLGSFIAFIVALAAMKFLVNFLVKYGFRWFGIYRIVLALSIIILITFHKI